MLNHSCTEFDGDEIANAFTHVTVALFRGARADSLPDRLHESCASKIFCLNRNRLQCDDRCE